MLDHASRILVTGGAGFIGSHIAERLVRRGCQVRILDDFSTGSRTNVQVVASAGGHLLELMEGDIRNPQTVKEAMAGITHVVHQAALASVQRSVENPAASNEVNITGTLLLLEEARKQGVGRFLYAGSSSVYGDQPELPKRESMAPNPRSPYALTKLTAELYGAIYHSLHGLPTVTLRYFNVFGPRQTPDSQYAAVIPLFFKAVLQGEPPTIFGDGGQTRDFTFIDNVVDGNILALEADPAQVGGRVMNVACGDRISLLQLLETISRLAGVKIKPIFAPPRPGDVRDSQAGIEEARRLLGFQPKIALEEGLTRTLKWFRSIA